MIDLKDTASLMTSENYKERFYAEYWQTKVRYEKLHDIVVKYEAGKLNFKPDCSIDLLKEQKAAMGKYLYCLEVRAQIEGIDLNKIYITMNHVENKGISPYGPLDSRMFK